MQAKAVAYGDLGFSRASAPTKSLHATLSLDVKPLQSTPNGTLNPDSQKIRADDKVKTNTPPPTQINSSAKACHVPSRVPSVLATAADGFSPIDNALYRRLRRGPLYLLVRLDIQVHGSVEAEGT